VQAIEERKARVLRDAGFDMDLDGKDSHSTQYQNATTRSGSPTSSCRRSSTTRSGHCGARGDGAVIRTARTGPLPPARHAAWECADRHAVRHHHQQVGTTANTGRINARTRAASTCT